MLLYKRDSCDSFSSTESLSPRTSGRTRSTLRLRIFLSFAIHRRYELYSSILVVLKIFSSIGCSSDLDTYLNTNRLLFFPECVPEYLFGEGVGWLVASGIGTLHGIYRTPEYSSVLSTLCFCCFTILTVSHDLQLYLSFRSCLALNALFEFACSDENPYVRLYTGSQTLPYISMC